MLQLYFAQLAPTKWVRYAQQLVAFARVPLPPGPATVPFSLLVQVADMAAWDSEAGAYLVHAGNYSLSLGLDSASAGAGGRAWTVPVQGAQWCRPAFPGAPQCTAGAGGV